MDESSGSYAPDDELRRKWETRDAACAASGRPYVTLYADYADWALWTHSGLLPENALPLTPETKLRIKAWLNAYSGDPRPDWPLWEVPPGVDRDDDEEAWVAEGASIRECIFHEIGDRFDVYFDT